MNGDRNNGSVLMAALVGGLAGALVVYFSDEKRRKKVMDKFEEIIEEGADRGNEVKDRMDDAINRGRKNLAGKLRQAEKRIAGE